MVKKKSKSNFENRLKEAESNQKMIEIQSYFTGLPEVIY